MTLNKSIRILIIEDSEDDALLQLRKIKKEGYDPDYKIIKSIPDLKNALEHESWDIILSDYNLPGFTGLDVFHIFQSYHIDIPFIIISGKIGEETAVEAMRLGIHDYIMKDNLSRLIPAIEREIKEAGIRVKKHMVESDLVKEINKFESFINLALLGVAIVRNDGKILFVNPAAEKMFGYSLKELRNLDDLIDKLFPKKQDRDWVNSYYKNEFDPVDRFLDIDFPPVLCKDGSIKYVKLKSGILDDESFFFEIEDITIEKLAAQALEENQKRLSQIIQTINDSIIEIKPDDKDEYIIISANLAFFNTTRLLFDDVYSAPVEKIFKHSGKFMSNLRKSVETGKSIFWEEELTFPEARVIWDIYLSPLFGSDKKLLRLVCSANDITERKKSEDLLKKSESKFRNIASHVSDAIWEWNIADDAVWWNEGIQHLFGYKKEEVKNNIQWWKNKIHPHDKDRILKNIEGTFDHNDKRWQDHLQFLCSDGSYKLVDCKATISYDETGEPERLIGAMIDQTTRKEQDELRLQSLIEGADTERKNLARELHDNLGQILTLSHIKLRSLLETDRDGEIEKLSEIEKLVGNSIQITRNLSHSLIPKALNDFGLIPSLQNLIEMISYNSSMVINLHSNFDEDQRFNGKIEVNLYRIIQEALNNTLKHAKATNVSVQLLQHQEFLTVMVEDDGKGFNFKKTARNPGIGIQNIFNRVLYLNGEIEIDSRPGKGTLINLEVPLN
jgi:PAS domain S-box-containing protein